MMCDVWQKLVMQSWTLFLEERSSHIASTQLFFRFQILQDNVITAQGVTS